MRQLTAREKRIASMRRTKNRLMQNKKVVALSILTVFLLLGGVGFLLYENFRPETLRDVIGSNYDSVEWMYKDSKETAEDLKKYHVKRIYPGSLDATTYEECKFYYKDEYVGSVTFLGSGDMLVYENRIFKYTKPTEQK